MMLGLCNQVVFHSGVRMKGEFFTFFDVVDTVSKPYFDTVSKPLVPTQ